MILYWMEDERRGAGTFHLSHALDQTNDQGALTLKKLSNNGIFMCDAFSKTIAGGAPLPDRIDNQHQCCHGRQSHQKFAG
jgi:hypothetical protein